MRTNLQGKLHGALAWQASPQHHGDEKLAPTFCIAEETSALGGIANKNNKCYQIYTVLWKKN